MYTCMFEYYLSIHTHIYIYIYILMIMQIVVMYVDMHYYLTLQEILETRLCMHAVFGCLGIYIYIYICIYTHMYV